MDFHSVLRRRHHVHCNVGRVLGLLRVGIVSLVRRAETVFVQVAGVPGDFDVFRCILTRFTGYFWLIL